jgi:hypothetical protein
MQMQEIRTIAKNYGIKTARANKVELVRSIQVAEGNFNCFATAKDGICDQVGCIWRTDCFEAAKKKAN